MPISGVRNQFAATIFGALALSIGSLGAPAFALDEIPNEEENLKACERNLCGMILSKDKAGDDLTCDISKTWAKEKIKKGAGTKSLSWGFGDARCTVDLKAKRDNIVSSLTDPEHTFKMESHTVNCLIEQKDEPTKIDVTLAPIVTFKDGKATKAQLNITKVEAPTVIKAVITGADWIEKNVGLFHSEMLEEINEFIEKKCKKRYPDLVKK